MMEANNKILLQTNIEGWLHSQNKNFCFVVNKAKNKLKNKRFNKMKTYVNRKYPNLNKNWMENL